MNSNGSMKILIVSRSFYPINTPRSFRTTELVKEFSRQGHDVTLLTIRNEKEHPAFEREHGVIIKDLGPLAFSDIDTSSSVKAVNLLKRAARRGLSQFFEYPDIELMWKVKNKLREESGYDLMISIAVPHPIHWGVAWARDKNHPVADTWVADCGDPFMGSDMDTFKKLFYFKYFEKAFCRKADAISVPIEGAIEAYYPEFHDKIEVIPQGFNFEEVEIDKEAYSPNEVPTFAYAGGFIPGLRDPRKFLDYMAGLDKAWKFILYSRDRDLLEPYVEKTGGKVEVRDYIPREELLRELSHMDFLVNFENSSPRMLPSKLIDYYLTGRPVLSVNGSEVDTEALDHFLDRDYSHKFNYESIDRYRIGRVCDKFLQLCVKS